MAYTEYSLFLFSFSRVVEQWDYWSCFRAWCYNSCVIKTIEFQTFHSKKYMKRKNIKNAFFVLKVAYIWISCFITIHYTVRVWHTNVFNVYFNIFGWLYHFLYWNFFGFQDLKGDGDSKNLKDYAFQRLIFWSSLDVPPVRIFVSCFILWIMAKVINTYN